MRPHTHLLVEFNHPSNEASTECRVEGVGNDEQIFGGKGLHVHLGEGRGGGGARGGEGEGQWNVIQSTTVMCEL